MKIKPSLTIDTDRLVAQRRLIDMLVENVRMNEIETVIKADLNELIGIQGILDAVSGCIRYKPCINEDAIADLANETVDKCDLENLMELAENALIDFWSSPEGADDLKACLAVEV